MSVWQAVVLGLAQGVAEFLPISSSGHLVLLQEALGLGDTAQYIVFDVLLHVGTLLSVLVMYRADVMSLLGEAFGTVADVATKGKLNPKRAPSRRMLFMLFIASIPLVAGAVLEGAIETFFSSTLFVGVALLFTGIVLFFMEFMTERKRDEVTGTYRSAFVVGLFQLAAIFPGVSRSGMTIFGGVATGFKKEFAVRFSFLLSGIAILGATAFSVPDALEAGTLGVSAACVAAGMISAFIAGILAIKLLLTALRKGRFIYFSYYLFIVGTLTVLINIFA